MSFIKPCLDPSQHSQPPGILVPQGHQEVTWKFSKIFQELQHFTSQSYLQTLSKLNSV